MKKIIYFVPLFAIAVILLAFLVFCPFDQQLPDTNFETVDITHFDLYDNASGSWVQGAMFAGVSEGTRQVVITAHLWLSSKDFGGVEFGIPQGWVVTEKYSSYPDGDIDARPEYYISEWRTGSSLKYTSLVRITPDLNFSSLGEGNEGYVVLVLQPEDDAHPTEECRILVSVGSEMVNNTSVIHPTYNKYSLNFSLSG
ncbi:MAG: hypothetical protein GX097_03145 [Methanomicrobiales archaeon]|nr:hypothetical protein [Methanomicrobiales archaeon]